MSDNLHHPALPMPLSWLNAPTRSTLRQTDRITIEAPARSDWFIDPAGAVTVLNAPALVGTPPDADFTLHARARVEAAAAFDAAVLFIHGDDGTWAKLCLERSPEGQLMIVSVVTRDRSDDCNSEAVEGEEAWLRIARRDGAFAFHASTDGRRWNLVRFFALPAHDVRIGFEAQSPTGDGCTATFDEVGYTPKRLSDLRDGS